MRTHLIAAATLVVVLMAHASGWAAPLFELDTDDLSGKPLVLWSNQGYSGFDTHRLGTLIDGGSYYVVTEETNGGGYGFHVLDPTLASSNDAATTAGVGYVRHIDSGRTECYKGSVPGDVPCWGGVAAGGMTRAVGSDTVFQISSGGTFTLTETQPQDDGGNYDPTTTKGARVASKYIGNMDTSDFKKGLALYGSTGNTDEWRVLVAGQLYTDPNPPQCRYVRKSEVGALDMTGTGTPPSNYGTRSFTVGGLVKAAAGDANSEPLVENLVPDIDDYVMEMTVNPANGYLYFLTAGDGHVYLSAVQFEWGNLADPSIATIVDLDPDSEDNTFYEITYDSGDADPDLTGAGGLVFSPDGSMLYVSNNSTRVFIFNVVPEPATIALLGLGLAGIVLRRRRR